MASKVFSLNPYDNLEIFDITSQYLFCGGIWFWALTTSLTHKEYSKRSHIWRYASTSRGPIIYIYYIPWSVKSTSSKISPSIRTQFHIVRSRHRSYYLLVFGRWLRSVGDCGRNGTHFEVWLLLLFDDKACIPSSIPPFFPHGFN